jgi:hypothetical protein
MKISVRVIDVDPRNLGLTEPANALIKRQVAENLRAAPSAAVPLTDDTYHILNSPVDRQTDWVTSRKTPEVYVPLFPYDIGRSAEILAQFGAQLGAVAASHAIAKGLPTNLFVIMSQVFDRPDGQTGYRIYAGIAAC